MSEKESTFIKVLTTVLAGFLLAILLGAFSFYSTTQRRMDVQDERQNTTIQKVETMRVEWREDMKEIKADIGKIAEKQDK